MVSSYMGVVCAAVEPLRDLAGALPGGAELLHFSPFVLITHLQCK